MELLPISSLPPSSFSSRLVLEKLVASSIRRCVTSGNPCRVTVSLRCFDGPGAAPCAEFSVSDTGMGSNLRDLQNIAEYCLKTMQKSDGSVSATTTCSGDEDIYNYHFNLKGRGSTTLEELPTKPKNGGKFSGTQISITDVIGENIEDYLDWVKGFMRKTLVLNIPLIAFEILIDHVKGTGPALDHIQFSGGILLSKSLSSIECITSGLQEFLLTHGNVIDKECPSCSINKDNLKIGSGCATSENRKGNGHRVEAVIAIDNLDLGSNNSCVWRNFSSTKVLFFQNFVPCPLSPAIMNTLNGISWQDYGLCLRTVTMDGDGQVILEWNNLASNTHISIAIHCYDKQYPSSDIHLQGQARRPDQRTLRRAVKLALDNLKSKYVGSLLSHHASKIRNYAPDLSRSIASLILSSNDLSFRGECASLLGLKPLDIDSEGRIESCIRDKIIEIIDVNDRNPKRSKQSNPGLFEPECADDEEFYVEDNEQEEEYYDVEHEF